MLEELVIGVGGRRGGGKGREGGGLININLSREVVIRQIDRLKIAKSPGPNEIFPRVLKESISEISGRLTEVLRKLLETVVVPVSWRQAHVIPVFKKEDKSAMQNYRQISSTSVAGRMLEPIIADSIRDYTDRHNLIHDSQHGFIKRVLLY